MIKAVASAFLLALLLTAVLAVAINAQGESPSRFWTANRENVEDSNARSQADQAWTLQPSDSWQRLRSTPGLPLMSTLDPSFAGLSRQPFRGRGLWDFSRSRGWKEIARVDHDSAELVIGLEKPSSDHSQSVANLAAGHGGEVVDYIAFGNSKAVVADVPFSEIPSFVSDVEEGHFARYVEPNVMFEANVVPNDPGWSAQWGPRRIEADYAWNTTTGGEIVVAVLDTGIDYTHPDLQPNYIALGFNWVKNNTDPKDDAGHGTHCAGIIGAVLNNGLGIAGMAQIHIMAEKCLDSSGSGSASDGAKAVIHAVDQGARIISCSFGGDEGSSVFHEAVQYAWDSGALIIGAAGNNGWNLPHYPSDYPEVVSVAATDQADLCAPWSNWGETIEVAAPGVDIYSTTPSSGCPCEENYDNMSGTSMACPHVAGVAALIWSQYPNYTNQEVRMQLRLTAQDLGDPGFDVHYGYGRVNARRAVEGLQDHDLGIFALEAPKALWPSEEGPITLTVTNLGRCNETNLTVEYYANGTRFDTALISFIRELGGFATVNTTWLAPTLEGVYEITVHIVPVVNETFTGNNQASKSILVRTPRTFRVPEDYSTIKEAVGKALSGWGDTIVVAPGTYYEHMTINKDDLTLVGESADTTIIDANYSSYLWQPLPPPWPGIPLGHAALRIRADNVNISRFTIQRSVKGIEIEESSGLLLRNVSLVDNIYSFGFTQYNPEELSNYLHDIDISNTVDGKPIYYWINEEDRMVPLDAGYIAAVGCINITMRDLEMTNNHQGILAAYCQGLTIENVTASFNRHGINVFHSSGVSIKGNAIRETPWGGITIVGCEGSIIADNHIESNFTKAFAFRGIDLRFSSGTTIFNNTITMANNFTTGGDGVGWGIYVDCSDNVAVTENRVSGMGDSVLIDWLEVGAYEIGMNLCGAHSLTIERNTLENLSWVGIQISQHSFLGDSWKLWGFSNNIIRNNTIIDVGILPQKIGYAFNFYDNDASNMVNNYICKNAVKNSVNAIYGGYHACGISNTTVWFHNNFINNTFDLTGAFGNVTLPWNTAYPSGGNYWSSYPGEDLYSGPHQNETGSDGIGDIPHTMKGGRQVDNYPLMNPWKPPDLTVTKVNSSQTLCVEGSTLNANVFIENLGEKAEASNVTLYADIFPTILGDELIIGDQSVLLLSEGSSTLLFEWNTTGLAKGDYTLSARASEVPSETNVTNNMRVAGSVVAVISQGHDIAVTDVVLAKTVSGQTHPLAVEINVKNFGSYAESFNVTVYVNASLACTFADVFLASGDFATLGFAWNITEVEKGDYNITACASPVSEEAITVDNSYSCWVCVTLPGDVDGDFDVDIYDIVLLSDAYGTEEGDPRFFANGDLDGDGDIDIYDIVIAAGNYGESW